MLNSAKIVLRCCTSPPHGRWFVIRLGQPVSPRNVNIRIGSETSSNLGTLQEASNTARLFEGVDAIAWVAPDGTVVFFNKDEVSADCAYFDGEDDFDASSDRRAM